MRLFKRRERRAIIKKKVAAVITMGVVWTRGSRSLGILLDPPSLSDAARTIIADDDEQQGIQEAVRGLSVDPWRRGVNLTPPEQSEFQKWKEGPIGTRAGMYFTVIARLNRESGLLLGYLDKDSPIIIHARFQG